MPRHEEQTILPFGAEELFSVVADVRDYPSFVPWCSGAHIRREDARKIIADLVIGFGPFQESFTSEVTLERPRQILVRAIEGPLEHLTNSWTFKPEGHKTQVDFVIDFQFKSHLLDHVAAGMFHQASTRMVGAFEARVHALHLMRQETKGHSGAKSHGDADHHTSSRKTP